MTDLDTLTARILTARILDDARKPHDPSRPDDVVTAKTEFPEIVEPSMSERDQDFEMDARAARDAAYESELDEYGRWA